MGLLLFTLLFYSSYIRFRVLRVVPISLRSLKANNSIEGPALKTVDG